jgi:hypothetical protein
MHNHEDSKLEGRYLYSILITAVVLVAEIAGGIWTGSLALLSDSAHVFTDILALAISYGAFKMANRPHDTGHPFGITAWNVCRVNQWDFPAIISIGIWWEPPSDSSPRVKFALAHVDHRCHSLAANILLLLSSKQNTITMGMNIPTAILNLA